MIKFQGEQVEDRYEILKNAFIKSLIFKARTEPAANWQSFTFDNFLLELKKFRNIHNLFNPSYEQQQDIYDEVSRRIDPVIIANIAFVHNEKYSKINQELTDAQNSAMAAKAYKDISTSGIRDNYSFYKGNKESMRERIANYAKDNLIFQNKGEFRKDYIRRVYDIMTGVTAHGLYDDIHDKNIYKAMYELLDNEDIIKPEEYKKLEDYLFKKLNQSDDLPKVHEQTILDAKNPVTELKKYKNKIDLAQYNKLKNKIAKYYFKHKPIRDEVFASVERDKLKRKSEELPKELPKESQVKEKSPVKNVKKFKTDEFDIDSDHPIYDYIMDIKGDAESLWKYPKDIVAKFAQIHEIDKMEYGKDANRRYIKRIIDEMDESGGSIIGDIGQKIKHVLFNTGSPQTDKIESKYGDWLITNAKIQRKPVDKILKDIINVLSFGKFNNYKQNYDDVFHLAAIFEIKSKSGEVKYLLTEKRPNIFWSEVKSLDEYESSDSLPIKLGSFAYRNITLSNMLDQTRKIMGDKFSKYNARDNNCQSYILALFDGYFKLAANSSTMTIIKNYIYQDMTPYLTDMSTDISKKVTDLGHVFNRILYGAKLFN